MELDILTPEFISLADKAQKLFKKKEEATNAFKELWVNHKKELAELDNQAAELKDEYERAVSEHKKTAIQKTDVAKDVQNINKKDK